MRITSNWVPGLNMTAPTRPDSGSTFAALGLLTTKIVPCAASGAMPSAGSGTVPARPTTGPATVNVRPAVRSSGLIPGSDSA